MKLALGPAAVLVGLLSLTACGSATAPVAAPSAAITSAAVATSSAVPAPLNGSSLAARMNKAYADAKSGKMTMAITPSKTTSGAASATGPVTMVTEFLTNSAGQMDLKMSMGAAGETMEVLLVSGTMYVKMPTAKAGKPWLRIDSNGSSPIAQQLKKSLDDADPRRASKAYDGATVTLVGNSGGISQYQLSGVAGAPGVQTLMWIEDATGRPQRITTQTAEGSADITFSDWGAPVTIAAPAADQVTDLK